MSETDINIPISSYTFHPRAEGWSRVEELVLQIQFTESEMTELLRLRTLSLSITERLQITQASGIGRNFVLSGATGIPWGYSLQDREYSVRVIGENLQKLDEFIVATFTEENEPYLSRNLFTQDVITDVITLRDGMAEFIDGSQEI